MNAAAPPDSATPLDQRIRAEQIRLLYAQAPLGTIASLLIAPMLALALWEVVPRPVLLIWLALLETAILVRLLLALAFQRRARDTSGPLDAWAARYAWACAASGAGWGGCVVLLVLAPSLAYETFIALILGGVLMGGVLTMTPVLSAYLAYALPLALPPVLWLFLQDDPLRVAMGASGILYLLLALGTAHRYHQTLAQSLRLALDNLGLAQSFARAKEQAEEVSRRLAEQQAALRGGVQAMRELYEVISTPRRRPGEQIQAMLAMGCQRFGLAVGILSRIEDERYEIVQAIAPDGSLAPGDCFPLADTYCRETLRAEEPLAFERASTGPERQHPCYRRFGLEAYLGASVRVGGRCYGTLNFSDVQPRPTPFTTVDRELIQLMAQWVGGALEQEQMAAAAQKQQTLLAHASRLNTLGEMASGLAHEINQPITAITLYSEVGLARLRQAPAEPAVLRETLEKIAAQSARAQAIIQQVRYFARQSKPQYAAVRIDELFGDIADFLSLETRRHHVQLRQDLAPNLPPALADALQVQQVILNLVRNAVDAIADSKGLRTIILSARQDQSFIKLAVRDTGSGVAPDLLGQLPRPFFTTKADGLGLGLSISQSIVEAHGGRLWATPNTDGPGVTFHFTLPVATRASLCEQPAAALSLETG